MEEKNADLLLEELETSLKKVWRKYHSFIIPGGSDLSPVQVFLLKYVHCRGVCIPSEIAGEFGITLGAVTGLIDRLIKTGLVKRTRSEKDRRLVLIELTASGKEMIDLFERDRARKISILAGSFGPDDIKTLAGLLNRFDSVLEGLAGK